MNEGKKGKNQASDVAGEATEFQYIPIDNIITSPQVRSGVNIESDSFKALMESIKTRGILEPLLVVHSNGTYKLLCGERRLLAALTLGLQSVPARIMTVDGKDEIIAHQLTENLQREDLNPIDQARGILSFIQARHPDRNYDVDGLVNDLVTYDRRQGDLPEGVADTVSATALISGKSTRTLSRMLSLLKLPDPIQKAVSDGTLPVSQGYLFAANQDCPFVTKLFEQVVKKPATNAVLENLLTDWKKPKSDQSSEKPVSLSKKVSSLKTWRNGIEKSTTTFKAEELQKFLDELQALVGVVQERLQDGKR